MVLRIKASEDTAGRIRGEEEKATNCEIYYVKEMKMKTDSDCWDGKEVKLKSQKR